MLDFIVLGRIPVLNANFSFTLYLIFVLILGIIFLEIHGTVPTPKIILSIEKSVKESRFFKFLMTTLKVGEKILYKIISFINIVEPKIMQAISKNYKNYLVKIRTKARLKYFERTN